MGPSDLLTKSRGFVCVVVMALVFVGPFAYAANELHALAELRYERESGAEGCPSESDLRDAVAARLGYDPFESKEGLDTIVVRVKREGARLRGSIERVDRARAQRGRPTVITSNAGDCAELGSSLAVALAIAVDPLSLTREPPAARAPAEREVIAPPLPATSNVASRESPSPPATTPDPPPQVVVAAGPAISWGALPSASPGIRVAAGLSMAMLEVTVEGRFDPPVKVEDRVGAVEASLALATLVPCFRYRFALGCAEVSAGALRGTGLGFDHTREDNTFYMSAGARLGFEVALTKNLAVRALFEGIVPLRPTRLEADGALVWSTPAFSFSIVPMLVGRFP